MHSRSKEIKAFLGDQWVLVIDPAPNMRDSMRRFLHNLGIKNVKLMSSAAEAKREFLSTPVGLFIVEWLLPDQNGLEFCREIRQKKKFAKIPFLLVTGENNRSDVMLASEAGINRYLLKPFAYDEFVEQLVQLVDQAANPGRIAEILEEGDHWFRQREILKAENCYFLVLSEKADSAKALTGMGKIRLTRKEYDKAIEYFEQALLANAKYLEAYGALLEAYELTGQKDKQLSLGERAHKLSPDNPRYTLVLAGLYLEHGEIELAESFFKKTISLSPKLAEAHRGLGNVQFVNNEYDKAIKSFKKALDLLPADLSLVNALGLSYVKKDMIEKGIEYYRMGLNIDAGDWRLLFNMAYAQEKLGDVQQAILFYQKTLNANPGLEKALRRLEILQKNGAVEPEAS